MPLHLSYYSRVLLLLLLLLLYCYSNKTQDDGWPCACLRTRDTAMCWYVLIFFQTDACCFPSRRLLLLLLLLLRLQLRLRLRLLLLHLPLHCYSSSSSPTTLLLLLLTGQRERRFTEYTYLSASVPRASMIAGNIIKYMMYLLLYFNISVSTQSEYNSR
jgi:hypothetical protein